VVATTRSVNISDFNIANGDLPSWAHPEVHYWYPEWRKIRDCVAGERAIKDAGTDYLAQLESMEGSDYNSYLDRATFYNFTGRTVEALTGSLMRRRPVIDDLPTKLNERLKVVSREKHPFHMFSTMIARENIQMGRVGVLVDLPRTETTQPKPYLCSYTCENILDWEEDIVNDELVLTKVVLREQKRVRNTGQATGNSSTMETTYVPRYRELSLEEGAQGTHVYVQRIYERDDTAVDFELVEANLVDTITPMRQGVPLDFIPFCILGPRESRMMVEKPPMMDIARLNLSHYQSYAWLEHGRFFTGFPIYYVEAPSGGDGSEAEFELGSSNVWVTPAGAKPGLLEMNGQGLKFLADALDQKESQAASLGGRMIGIRTQAVAESDNALKMTERNEQSVLLQVAMALDAQMSKVLQWWAFLSGVSLKEAEKIVLEYNKDFLFDTPGAREFRAIHSMYQDGVIPVDVIYSYFKKSSLIPDWMSLEEFKKQLDRVENFPNNPDIAAKQEGFPDAKTQIAVAEAEKDRKATEKAAEATAKAAKEAADRQPVGVPPQQVPPNGNGQ